MDSCPTRLSPRDSERERTYRDEERNFVIEHGALLDEQQQSYVYAHYLSATSRFCIVEAISEVSVMGIE